MGYDVAHPHSGRGHYAPGGEVTSREVGVSAGIVIEALEHQIALDFSFANVMDSRPNSPDVGVHGVPGGHRNGLGERARDDHVSRLEPKRCGDRGGLDVGSPSSLLV